MHTPPARVGAGLAPLPPTPPPGCASSAAAAGGAHARAAVPCQGGASLAGATNRCQGAGKGGTHRKERKHLLPAPPQKKTGVGLEVSDALQHPKDPPPRASGSGSAWRRDARGGGDGEVAAVPRFHHRPNSCGGNYGSPALPPPRPPHPQQLPGGQPGAHPPPGDAGAGFAPPPAQPPAFTPHPL